jgi:hypothetical protein
MYLRIDLLAINMITELITETQSNARLGATFHRSFSLVRSAVTQVLKLAGNAGNQTDNAGCLDRDTINKLSHLGSIYVEAMPRYGYGTGLLGEGYCLTQFGQAALKADALLEQFDTLWLMHYFLSATQGPGPVFWHDLVTSRFLSGNEFKVSDIEEQIANVFQSREGKPLSQRSTRRTATIFLGTYAKEEGLGKLGLLKEIAPDTYRVFEPEPPSPWAFGYAFLHYWRTNFGDRLTINLDVLYGQSGLSTLFLCGAGRLNRMLSSLQMEGYIDVYRVAPPYQVVLLHQDANSLLQKLYGDYELT